ncbi:MAG: hypothetical protein N5P05_004572 [Chroococcopsis gigantea SAG 12.99]|jgi:hypothetical protein|nr:hypothetical protein [Chroococcopsis gigantea SAG 12.99]
MSNLTRKAQRRWLLKILKQRELRRDINFYIRIILKDGSEPIIFRLKRNTVALIVTQIEKHEDNIERLSLGILSPVPMLQREIRDLAKFDR